MMGSAGSLALTRASVVVSMIVIVAESVFAVIAAGRHSHAVDQGDVLTKIQSRGRGIIVVFLQSSTR